MNADGDGERSLIVAVAVESRDKELVERVLLAPAASFAPSNEYIWRETSRSFDRTDATTKDF